MPGHVSKQCQNRKTCQKCFRKQPTILHAEETIPQNEIPQRESQDVVQENTTKSGD